MNRSFNSRMLFVIMFIWGVGNLSIASAGSRVLAIDFEDVTEGTSFATGVETPQLAPIRSAIAIEGAPFQLDPPALRRGTFPIVWSLADQPEGMTIHPITGVVEWPSPAEGRLHVTTVATNLAGNSSVEWTITVVPAPFTDPQIISTKHIDLVVEPDIADWVRDNGAQAYLDACFEYYRDAVGLIPFADIERQVFYFDPTISSLTSGNPARAGPFWWSTDPVEGWQVGGIRWPLHNNFSQVLNTAFVGGNVDWAGDYWVRLRYFLSIGCYERMGENPAAFGVFPPQSSSFLANVDLQRDIVIDRGQPLVHWISGGGRAEDFTGDRAHAGRYICQVLADQYGTDVLENTVRLFRREGLPNSLIETADTPIRKNTLLFAAISAAAETDLRGFFDSIGFDTDIGYWNFVLPQILQTMATLPDNDVRGWKYSPISGTYIRRTPWKTTWHAAERMANRDEGHLVTVLDIDHHDWLRSRFGTSENYFIGYTDELFEGVWIWTSGISSQFELWANDAPNNAGGIEDYAVMNFDDLTGGWNDVPATNVSWGLIESATPFYWEADTNQDGRINHNDGLNLIEKLLGPARAANSGLYPYLAFISADLEHDWDVDLLDIAKMQCAHSALSR